ncbi:rod shape-determining protein [Alicyclobacillus fastidiosus]|uniref:Rod shape-determining protein n=1 Tax=Alicyclobacillus fastidiosus TaxID=392011 RepID=A0ABV5AD96_9BACL|nr:rod shape-determining protein [Alicyclobacillus fastidiosus]WEH08731.1 rod shape-determining protein [Alicyclobacillus fastidiosus]
MSMVIDFGTSRLRISTAQSPDFISEASVVARREEGPIVTGDEALRMVGRTPKSVEIVWPVVAGAVRESEAAVTLLQRMVSQHFPRGLGLRMPITMALPANLTSVERRGLEEVAHQAGAKQVRFIDSLVAAAIGAGLAVDTPQGALVVDLGAGTTEVGLLSMRGVVSSQRLPRGMSEIDEEVVETIRRDYGFLVGLHAVQQVKHQLADDETETFVLVGRNLATGLPGKVEVKRQAFEAPLAAYYTQIVDLIRTTIESCPPELVGDIMDKGVVLVGGGANSVVIQKALQSRIEVPISAADDPDHAVIRGLKQLSKQQGGAHGLKERARSLLRTS